MRKFLEKLKVRLTPRFIRKIQRIESKVNSLNEKIDFANNKLLSINIFYNNLLNNITNINNFYKLNLNREAYNHKLYDNNKYNIAIVKCTGNLNIGNEFINAGGIYLLRKIFSNSKFYEYEFLDSATIDNYKYPTPALLNKDIKEIQSNCDIMFLLCGSIISLRAKNILFELSKIKIRKVMLGASCLIYDENENSLCYSLQSLYDEIFCRDNITYSLFGNSFNVYSAIDLAFFTDYISKNDNYICNYGGGYALINIDLIRDNMQVIEYYKQLLKEQYKNVYVYENTSNTYYDIQDFIYAGYWDSIYKLIAKADFIVTNRIHTSLVCISNSVSFKYIGEDNAETIGRSSLFNMINFRLEKDKIYNKDDLKEYTKIIEEKKHDFVNLLKSIYCSDKDA